MKKLCFVLIFLALLSCEERKEAPIPFPVIVASEDEWVVYEGIIPLEGEELNIELSLMPGGMGVDSYYKLDEQNTQSDGLLMGRSSMGQYTTLLGMANNNVVIQLHKTRLKNAIVYGNGPDKDRRRMIENLRKTHELFFKSNGTSELIMLDDNFQPVSDDPKYRLRQRSKPFTIEGYITFLGDTADFFEQNTRETWAVAKLGLYNKAKEIYATMAKVKYEGIYVKALGYSVEHVTASGKDINALVLKNIYVMEPGPEIN